MGGTRFMVQWEEHPSHLATRLGQLLEHQTLVDVTLMCNTHTLRVHRAVLAACSPYFESILQRQLGAHPLIVLKDMQFSVLKSLIEFMYCGETSVTEDNLGSLLQAAKFFQVKGLSSMTKEALGLPSSPAKATTVNGESTKKSSAGRTATATKRMGMQTTLVSTAEVMNKQIASSSTTTIANTSGGVTRTGPAGDSASPGLKLPSNQATSTITTDTAQLLLNLSGSDASVQQQTLQPLQQVQVATSRVASTSTTQARPLLQMSSRNVRVSNMRGSNMLKVDPKTFGERAKVADGTVAEGVAETIETPRRRGRPLKKQINVMFQEKVMTDAEIALQKEADASRLALEALKKEMNTGDPGNAAAVAAELVEAEARAQEQQQQLDESGVKVEPEDQDKTSVLMETEDGSQTNTESASELVYQVTADGQVVATTAAGGETSAAGAAGNVTTYMEALKEAGLPTDLPILLDSGDGSYVTVNEEVLMNICNGGVLHYQVAEGNLVQGMDGQVVVQEGESSTSEEVQPQQQLKQATKVPQVIQPAPEVKPMGRRTNRVVTPPGGCGFTTARQIVKASMDKYRQEQGLRKFVVKEMQAAELILEPEDQVSEQEQHQQEDQHEQDAQQDEQQDQPEHQQLIAAVQGGSQVQALLQSFGDGEGQQEMVYLVTENADEVITGGNFEESTHGFAVVADGSSVDGTHAFSLEDGSIVVQEGQVEGGMSVEQALEAMMGGADTSGDDAIATSTAGGTASVVVSESGDVTMVMAHDEQSHVDEAESMRLVLSPDTEDKSNIHLSETKENVHVIENNTPGASLPVLTDDPKLEDALSLDDINEGAVSSPSKDIPLAVGLLPLKTALERIQSTPEHQPRKTRSSSISGQSAEGNGKRRSDSEEDSEGKKARTEDALDGVSIEMDKFETEEDSVHSYVVDQSLGVITEEGLKEAP